MRFESSRMTMKYLSLKFIFVKNLQSIFLCKKYLSHKDIIAGDEMAEWIGSLTEDLMSLVVIYGLSSFSSSEHHQGIYP